MLFTDTELDRVPYTTVFLDGPASAGPFVFWSLRTPMTPDVSELPKKALALPPEKWA